MSIRNDDSTSFTRDGEDLTIAEAESIIELVNKKELEDEIKLGNKKLEDNVLSSKNKSIIINGIKERIKKYSFSSYFKRYIYRKGHFADIFEQSIFDIPIKEFNDIITVKFNEYFKCNEKENEEIFPLKLSTVKTWLKGKVNPDRDKVMLLGFIFKESANVIENELIKKGLGEQGFDYKNIEENALAFCLKNKLNYSEYLEIVEDIYQYVENNIESILEVLNSKSMTEELLNKVNVAESRNDFERIIKNNISTNVTTVWKVILRMLKKGEEKFLNTFNDSIDNPKNINKTSQKNAAKKAIKTMLDEADVRKKWINECFKGDKVFDALCKRVDIIFKTSSKEKQENESLKVDFEKCIFKSLSFIDSLHTPLLKILSEVLYKDNFNLGSYIAYHIFENKYNEIIKIIKFRTLETYDEEDKSKKPVLISKYLFGESNIVNTDLSKKEIPDKDNLKKYINNYLSPDYLSKIFSRKTSVSREQLLISIALKEFLYVNTDEKVEDEEVYIERQNDFYDEADACLMRANMQLLDVNKPLDYILYMCCLFEDPLSAYIEIMLEIFEIDELEREFYTSEAYLKTIIAKRKEDEDKFNKIIIDNLICLGKAYKEYKIYDKAKEKFNKALEIMDEMISLNKEKFQDFDSIYNEIKIEL